MHAPAVEASFELLVGRQARYVHNRVRAVWPISAIPSRAGPWPGNQAAVVSPVEAEPWTILAELILHMRRLVENFVVVDAKDFAAPRCRADSTHLWREEACRYARHSDERREAVKIGHTGANRVARNF